MAHVKGGTTTRLGRDSISKRLGIKKHAGETVKAGNILVRQRGTKWYPGKNVRKGTDDTLYAAIAGVVKYSRRKLMKFNGKLTATTIVEVVPAV